MKNYIVAAFMLVALPTISHAKPTSYAKPTSNEFCGDRYCGQYVAHSHRVQVHHPRHHKTIRAITHKRKLIRVASIAPEGNGGISGGFFGGGLVGQAEQYMGMTARQVGVRSSQWCSAFLRKLTNASGVDDRAISWLNKPHVSKGCTNCIAVMRHHVGIVKGYDGAGNPILVSGNHNHIVNQGIYPKSRILAYVIP